MTDISKNFTVEDIHKIREWHYELRKEKGSEIYRKELREKAKRLLTDFPYATIVTLDTPCRIAEDASEHQNPNQ